MDKQGAASGQLSHAQVSTLGGGRPGQGQLGSADRRRKCRQREALDAPPSLEEPGAPSRQLYMVACSLHLYLSTSHKAGPALVRESPRAGMGASNSAQVVRRDHEHHHTPYTPPTHHFPPPCRMSSLSHAPPHRLAKLAASGTRTCANHRHPALRRLGSQPQSTRSRSHRGAQPPRSAPAPSSARHQRFVRAHESTCALAPALGKSRRCRTIEACVPRENEEQGAYGRERAR